MKLFVAPVMLLLALVSHAQLSVNTKEFNKKSGVSVVVKNDLLTTTWPAGNNEKGQLVINLQKDAPLFSQLQILKDNKLIELAKNVEPAFILTVSRRDLISQNGWNIFFDRVQNKPRQSYKVVLEKNSAAIKTEGSRTVISIGDVKAENFTGNLEITLYNGSPLVNIAAVMSTTVDSTAILYDAGIIGKEQPWQNIAYADVYDKLQTTNVSSADSSKNQAVKYRTMMGMNNGASLAVFPAPHQYFYPLDEAFNLKFTWYGRHYRNLLDGYGIGIRQDPMGDNRFVPWFNAPPATKQRLNFFCYLGSGDAANTLAAVKQFTHNDKYTPLAGYKTMESHFHNEFVVKNIMANKPMPDSPSFLKVFKETGVDIVHLAEFHYTAHPQGPDELRLLELKYLFDMCEKYSSDKFLLLPGEEPNEFFGGHWLQIFPKPVYWIMSRKKEAPFVSNHPVYGKVYRIGNADEMLKLLEQEGGLAWTAHARTKGSTGYPDKYKNEPFFKSERFLGAAWKAMPADLSQDKLGNGRILDLLDDMNNWGDKKNVIAEADLFTIELENEMYAHLNVNYLMMDKLPSYKDGWPGILQTIRGGKFFTSTGEVLIPSFTVNGAKTGDVATVAANGKANVSFELNWTFPMSFAEIISGDGSKVYRHRIELKNTAAFGKQTFNLTLDLKGRKWVRLEAWDAAANGAFTQTVWLGE